MALETGEMRYKDDVEKFCNFSIYNQRRTPEGLVFINSYGTLAYAADIAFICLKVNDSYLITSVDICTKLLIFRRLLQELHVDNKKKIYLGLI